MHARTFAGVWNPWRALADLTHVALVFEHDLGPGTFGRCDYGPPPRIRLHAGLTQAQRRSTLAHELVHLERGPLHPGGCVAREEAAVEAEAARRLISWEHLVDAMVWSCDEHQVAEQLHVDVDTVIARLRGLTPGETRALDQLLDDAELRNP